MDWPLGQSLSTTLHQDSQNKATHILFPGPEENIPTKASSVGGGGRILIFKVRSLFLFCDIDINL